MVVLDELQKRKQHYVKIGETTNYRDVREAYIDMEAVLKPIDLYTIIEITKTLVPLVAQILTNFGPQLRKEVFDKKLVTIQRQVRRTGPNVDAYRSLSWPVRRTCTVTKIIE